MENQESPRKNRTHVVYGFFGVLAALMVGWIILTAVTGREWATVAQGQSETYLVRVADNPLEKAHGLAGSDAADLGDAIGMLFVYHEAETRVFTMKGMQYNLDFIWLRDGKIIKIDENVPAPIPGADPVVLETDPLLVDMVLEMPAGTADRVNYLVGHQLTIDLDP